MLRAPGLAVVMALATVVPANAEPDGIMGFMLDRLTDGADLDALSEGLRQLGPIVSGLAQQIDDPRNFDAPETLPNGDIILRRKPDVPKALPPVDPDQPQFSL
ncbi:hypothetical protein Q4511_01825 [Paracoccus sp. 1_MG-2023]|uniref:hypothetical protein n=1 Tax=unclassified Paracoccus (in: a-proteobacteria) TaxID=2688777 RepID=UPI001C08BF5A|nr:MULTISPECIES: hypothetical protein [unclassified Paracoccus (in: a-proteobacteria)]MBU2958658.1 hypothetical protein [Paracoccus sp. C2R09]MDO6667651.1 hypothetical protein [Paracoccus sp. 1_MG-2023]